MCEEALLKVKGVISFTFQMAMKRCTVRVRADLPTEVDLLFHTLLNCPQLNLKIYVLLDHGCVPL